MVVWSAADEVQSTVSTTDALNVGLPTNLLGVGARTLNYQTVHNPPPVSFNQSINCVCGVVIRRSVSHESQCPVECIKKCHPTTVCRSSRNESPIRAALRWLVKASESLTGATGGGDAVEREADGASEADDADDSDNTAAAADDDDDNGGGGVGKRRRLNSGAGTHE